MKILMTVMMALTVTSVFADDCTLGGSCKDEASCKAKQGVYADGKCSDPASNEKEANCSAIVSSQVNKGSTVGGKPATDAAAGADGVVR